MNNSIDLPLMTKAGISQLSFLFFTSNGGCRFRIGQIYQVEEGGATPKKKGVGATLVGSLRRFPTPVIPPKLREKSNISQEPYPPGITQEARKRRSQVSARYPPKTKNTKKTKRKRRRTYEEHEGHGACPGVLPR